MDAEEVLLKVAASVARHGATLEATLRENQRGNPRYAFLDPRAPSHAAYQAALARERQGTEEAMELESRARRGKEERKEEREQRNRIRTR